MIRTTTRKKLEKGQSFVELALSFTVIMAILAGLINVSDIYLSFMALRNAAQEGVNYAMYNPEVKVFNSTTGLWEWVVDEAGIKARVRNSSNFPLDLTNTTLVDVNANWATMCTGTPPIITITVTYHYELSAPFFGILLGAQTLPITATASGPIVTPCAS